MKLAIVKKLNFLILPGIIAILFAISYFHLLDNYELETLDIRFLLRPNIPVTDKVLFVDIGEDSIEKLGQFPLDRSYHALLIKALSEAGAKYVILDMFFSEPQEHDEDLEDALRGAANVYIPYVFDLDAKKSRQLPNASGYAAKSIERLRLLAKGEGHINIFPDNDGKSRRLPLYVRYGNTFHPYISFLAACDYLGISQKEVKILPGKYLLVGSYTRIPLDDRSNMIINFSGRWGTGYSHYSYVDILQSYLAKVSGQKPILDLKIFKDKVCVVGLTATGTTDLHPTPFEPRYPGVGIHAELLNSILNKRFISRVSREFNLVILMILGALVSLITLKTRPVWGLSILALVIFLFVILSILLFDFFGLWLDLFYPIAAISLLYLSLTFYKYISEWKKRLILDNELGIARKIQESFLPKKVPEVKGLDISVSMFTARQVGGDLYDFVEFDQGTLGVMIGDVSGKGIPASLFMAMVTGEFKFSAGSETAPNEVLSRLNSRLVKESASNLFVTMFYSIFDMKNMTISYSNGGHLPLAYLGHGADAVRFLDVKEGTPLGLMESAYGTDSIKFNKGDIFVLYTDGITEAMNTRSEMYGRERLTSSIESHRNTSSKALLHAIERDVRRFEPISRQHDDMTLVVIKID